MSSATFFFAGGGTGGHLYPAIAVAEKLIKLSPDSKIHFFCSSRDIDKRVLGPAGFEYTQLPAKGFTVNPLKFFEFYKQFLASGRIAREKIKAAQNPVVIGVGGFVAAPVCRAAYKLKVPLKLLNVDIVPGKANRLIANWADEIFVQFDDTIGSFGSNKGKVEVVGCPLREAFSNPQPDKVLEQLGLDKNKKILLITGASSGSANINEAICLLLDKLSAYAADWQIVHLSGRANFEQISKKYEGAGISVKVLDYFDDMAGLLSAAELVIGRSGAVSVAEYASAGAASICMPYPYHKDMHQYLNAGKLVEAGAGIIVDDIADAKERAEWLWEELEDLMKNEQKRRRMKESCASVAKKGAAAAIAERLLKAAEQTKKEFKSSNQKEL